MGGPCQYPGREVGSDYQGRREHLGQDLGGTGELRTPLNDVIHVVRTALTQQVQLICHPIVQKMYVN